ncbi:MAG: hypothetical protein PV345_00485 [Wolbachia sp.]|nr:hypothetical protein [Wolbachia sp.]
MLSTELNTPKLNAIKEKIESLIAGKKAEKTIIDKITVKDVKV